jgi:hypothetical protein
MSAAARPSLRLLFRLFLQKIFMHPGSAHRRGNCLRRIDTGTIPCDCGNIYVAAPALLASESG